jgi:hypothetical protein
VAKSQSDKPSKHQKTGMSNHPLDTEASRQSKVPPRGEAKKEKGPAHSTGTRRGHRLSRKPGRRQDIQADRRYVSKSAKGGKSGGSRAGLLSAGRKGGSPGGGSAKSRRGR